MSTTISPVGAKQAVQAQAGERRPHLAQAMGLAIAALAALMPAGTVASRAESAVPIVPMQFRGVWAQDQAACSQPDVTIQESRLLFKTGSACPGEGTIVTVASESANEAEIVFHDQWYCMSRILSIRWHMRLSDNGTKLSYRPDWGPKVESRTITLRRCASETGVSQ